MFFDVEVFGRIAQFTFDYSNPIIRKNEINRFPGTVSINIDLRVFL